jgi:hypothetical protein
MASRLSQLVTEIKQVANRVDADFDARAITALNRAQEYWAERMPWPGLKRTEDFPAPGVRDIVFPKRVARVHRVADLTENLTLDPNGQFENRLGPAYFEDGAAGACEWRNRGLQPVVSQPATDTKMEFQTTVSETQSVILRGLIFDSTASGTALELYEAEETVSVSDDTTWTESANSYREILAIEKPFNTTAGLVARDQEDTTIRARIAPWEDTAAYVKIETDFPVGVGTQLRVTYFTKPDQITSINDAANPAVPDQFLLWRAVGDIHWIQNQESAARVAWGKADELLQDRILAQKTTGGLEATTPSLDGLDWSGANLNDIVY